MSRFSPEALAEYQAQAVSTPVGSPLKYSYTPDNRLGANAIDYNERLTAQPIKLDVGSNLLLAFVGGYLLHEVLGSSVGTAFKGGISKRIGGS